MVAVLMDAHHHVRPGLIDNVAPPAHIRHLLVAVPGLVKPGIRVPRQHHIHVGRLQIFLQAHGDAQVDILFQLSVYPHLPRVKSAVPGIDYHERLLLLHL